MNAKAARRARAKRGEGDRLREEILAAAEPLLLRASNVDDVSIRDVAEAVGVTPPSIYLHFADKDDLIFAVCERHFADLEEHCGRAADAVDDPLEALGAMGRAYVEFALGRPEMYRFLFMEPTPERYHGRLRERFQDLAAFGRLITAVQRCIDAGVFPNQDVFQVATVLWSTVHGFASLRIAEPWFPLPDPDATLDLLLSSVATGLASG